VGGTVTGYLHHSYADSLAEFGTPYLLPKSGGWILKRQIPGFTYSDGMGCYPFLRRHLGSAPSGAPQCHRPADTPPLGCSRARLARGGNTLRSGTGARVGAAQRGLCAGWTRVAGWCRGGPAQGWSGRGGREKAAGESWGDVAYSDSLIERAEIRDPAPGTRYEIEWWLPLRLANGLYNIACVVSAPGESAPGPNFMNSD